MNLVADECVPRPVVDQLRSDGHTVTWIGESHPGIGDADVLALALQASAPLLTIDTDFGELVFRENRPSGGVVLLRLEGLSNQLKSDIVGRAVRDNGAQFAGKFTVVSPGGIRTRSAGGSG